MKAIRLLFVFVLFFVLAFPISAQEVTPEMTPAETPVVVPVVDAAPVMLAPGQLYTDLGTILAIILGSFAAGGGTLLAAFVALARRAKTDPDFNNALERSYMSIPLVPESRQFIRDLVLGFKEGIDLADDLTDGVLKTAPAASAARAPVTNDTWKPNLVTAQTHDALTKAEFKHMLEDAKRNIKPPTPPTEPPAPEHG